MIDLSLPAGVVGWAGSGVSGAHMGGHLHKFTACFLGPLQLQLAAGLIYPGEGGTADGHLQGISVAGRVGDPVHVFCQIVDGSADGGLVIKCPGGYLQPGPVQSIFKLPGYGVGSGGSQILPGSGGLPVAGVQKVLEVLAFVWLRQGDPGSGVDGILRLEGLGSGLHQHFPDGSLAFSAVFGNQLYNVRIEEPGLLQPPGLVCGGFGDSSHFPDSPGNVPENVVLYLLPQGNQRLRQLLQVLGRKHDYSPPKKRLSSLRFSAAASATMSLAVCSSQP